MYFNDIAQYMLNVQNIEWTVNAHCHLGPIYRFACCSRLCLIYKYVNNMRFIPEQFIMYQTNVVTRRSVRNVTNNRMIIIPFVSRDRCQKSVIILSSRIWNVLDNDIINLQYDQYRREIRKNRVFNYLCDKNVAEVLRM